MAGTTTIDTLIIVCCHAIWIGEAEADASGKENIEDGWLIESFQKGETTTFVKHIQAGLETLRSNGNAILVFSGGATKPNRSKLTEAGTYVAYITAGMQHEFQHYSDRIFVEGSATDSFQNILFSLLDYPRFVRECYFHRASVYSGAVAMGQEVSPSPQQLIVIGHDFKRSRFEKLHLPALRYPTEPSRFKYIGIDPPFDEQKMQQIKDGDAKRGYGVWKDDLYGTGALLAGKRVERGWTQQRKEALVEHWRKDLMKLGLASDEEIKEQFEKIIAFVEGTEDHFPVIAPWS